MFDILHVILILNLIGERQASSLGSQIHLYHWECLKNVGPTMRWDKFAWNRFFISKKRFVVWLALSRQLKTRDRLLQTGVVSTNTCPCVHYT